MEKTAEFYKISSSVIIGFLANLYDKYSVMLAFMSLAIIFDVVTGLIKSKCSGEKISSKKGTRGFFKKFVFIMAYAFGVFLDFFVPYVISTTGSNIDAECCFGLIIGAYITLNESISICENLYACNPDMFPRWIVSILQNFKDKINKNDKGE